MLWISRLPPLQPVLRGGGSELSKRLVRSAWPVRSRSPRDDVARLHPAQGWSFETL